MHYGKKMKKSGYGNSKNSAPKRAKKGVDGIDPNAPVKIIRENNERRIYNTVDTKYVGTTGSFEKQTFISKIKIYDEHMNCIGVAKLARPVK